MRRFPFFISLLFGAAPIWAQSATVEVLSTYDPIPEETPSTPIDMQDGSSIRRSGGIGGSGTGAGTSTSTDPAGCKHFRIRYQPGTGCGASWENPHDGALLQSSSLINRTSVAQSYTREVKATVKTTVDGSLTVSVASAKVGVAEEIEVKDAFPVVVPAKSTVSFNAFARLLDRSLDVLRVCDVCNEVLAIESAKVHAAFGVNGRYE